MRAALPERKRLERARTRPGAPRLVPVEMPPVAEAGDDGGRDGSIRALQAQIERLARHYAQDVARLRRGVDRVREAEARARVETLRALRRAEQAERDRAYLQGRLELAAAELHHRADEASALRAAADQPWWAVMRRRSLLREAGSGQGRRR